MDLVQTCPFCGKTTTVKVSQVALSAYRAGAMIYEAFPKKSAAEREVIKTGMCYDCQEKTFHNPAPGHEKEWGEPVGECACCGATLYEKHDNVPTTGRFTCSCCHAPLVRTDGGYIEECNDEEE